MRQIDDWYLTHGDRHDGGTSDSVFKYSSDLRGVFEALTAEVIVPAMQALQ